MPTYLVTGGAGFIGSNIVDSLVGAGNEVRVLDNFVTGKKENLESVKDVIELFEGDLRNSGDVEKAVAGADYIIHEGALPSVPRSIKDPVSTNEVNVMGTLNVLEAARENGVKRVVYAGSSSAYGDSPTLPKREDMESNPLSPYAVSKFAGEKLCASYYLVHNLETVCLRYFNVFGPRQDPESQYAAVIPKFIKAMVAGKKPLVYGDGLQSRDFTFIDNVVDGTVKAATAKKAAGELINVACNQNITVKSLVDELNAVLGTDIEPEYSDSLPGEVKHSLADIGKAKRLLGYEPKVKLKEGLKRTVDSFR